jgi:flagellar motor switch protein FliG
MTKILGTVDTKTLSVALKGCSRAVEQNILGNLSSRVRDMVAEERELAGPLPLADVKIAREEVLKSIRALIEAGEFRPNRGGDELVE